MLILNTLVSSCLIFQTFLVTGGYDGSGIASLSSTELLVETDSAWVLAGNLPTTRTGLGAVNIDQKILVTGE